MDVLESLLDLGADVAVDVAWHRCRTHRRRAGFVPPEIAGRHRQPLLV
ncbi:MAG: hypothetical protein Q7T56_06745 [Nocardioidaceae bacterium]|nr:hypothetical protein [Nocardioidaceae bacterium]